jgi:hypothetical protein
MFFEQILFVPTRPSKKVEDNQLYDVVVCYNNKHETFKFYGTDAMDAELNAHDATIKLLDDYFEIVSVAPANVSFHWDNCEGDMSCCEPEIVNNIGHHDDCGKELLS